jgi:CubicO group peptidase (beta-lactamase class C family)
MSMAKGKQPASGFEEIDGLYRKFARSEAGPGLSMAIVRDGETAYALVLGMADIEAERRATTRTLFRIASLTKSFTALTLLSLRDAHLVGLETPIEAYLPELAALPLPTRDSPPIRVRDLLAHTAGFVTDNAWADRRLGRSRADWLNDLRVGWPLARAPGTAFHYANLGYALLGEIIGRIGGQPYEEVVRRRILAPLGMNETTFDPKVGQASDIAAGYRREGEHWAREPTEGHGAFAAIGGLWTTAEDFARYAAFILSAWPPRDAPESGPVRRATVRELAQGYGPPRLTSTPFGPVASVYGAGFVRRVDERLGSRLEHTGSLPGFGAHVVLEPECGAGVFCFTNGGYAYPTGPNEAALGMLLATIPPAAAPVASDAVRHCAEALGSAYEIVDFGPIRPVCADNLLQDRPESQWMAEIAALRARLGAPVGISIRPRHALAAQVEITCEGGLLAAEMILAPSWQPAIQELAFRVPSGPHPHRE